MATRRNEMSRGAVWAMLGGLLCSALGLRPVDAQCVGDCNGDAAVAVDELVLGVDLALGHASLADCPAFSCGDDESVPVSCLVQGVGNALNGCAGCPLAAGAYTLQVADGTLRLATFAPIPFPSSTLVADIGAGRLPDCIHDVVVPFPGGFNAPTFCIPAVSFSVKLEQVGCGVGQIDSNGGSDYTITEVGDTSDVSATCDLAQECLTGEDAAVRVDIAVGDGVPDRCSSGTANALVTVPVQATVWLERSGDYACHGDGSFDPETGDELLMAFSQVLDFTTDTSTTRWTDLDGDGCSFAGSGPRDGFSSTGSCLDLDSNTLVVAAAAPASSALTVGDLSVSTRLPSTLSGPRAAMGASCASPPAIAIGGVAHRCVVP